jgi:exopolyphosphatase/guanosine-5'-triphosphate,3'-diphosphate pyrophosphatase
MRCAGIDVGTNTALCLIADTDGKTVTAVEDHAEIVRLGEGLDQSGELKPEAISRALGALRRYVDRMRELGCAHVIGVGTESLRAARNGHLFVNEATALLGTVGGRFFVIDGEREAQLSWRAVRAAFPSLEGTRTVLDIGGGSTELLVGDQEIDGVISLPIGSVRLTERILKHDPPSDEEKAELVRVIDEQLATAPPPRGTVVGIAGTVTTLAAMSLGITRYDAERVHGMTLSYSVLQNITKMLSETRIDDRRRTPGLDPKRADVIYAGAVILERVLHRASADQVLVSDRGIRWGLVYEAAGLG